MIEHKVAQGSAAWFAIRRGIPTAGSFHKLITPKKMEISAQRYDYACQLIAEKLLNTTLQSLDGLEHIERGKALEGPAVQQYEFVNDVQTRAVGFLTTDDGMVGASPDRLIVGRARGLEIKAPAPNTQISYLLFGTDEKYRPQVQGQMWVGELDDSDFYAYAERMPAVSIRTPRDEPFIKKLREVVWQFNDELAGWTEKAKALGIFQAFEEIRPPAEQEYADDLQAELAPAAPLYDAAKVAGYDPLELDREMGWIDPNTGA